MRIDTYQIHPEKNIWLQLRQIVVRQVQDAHILQMLSVSMHARTHACTELVSGLASEPALHAVCVCASRHAGASDQ